MKTGNVRWGLIILCAFFLALGIYIAVQPYGENTIFVAIFDSFALAIITGVFAFTGRR